jgi:hypothetical protein
MAQNITIPPASSQTLIPSNLEFQFTASQSCTLCFGTPSTAGTFSQIAGKTIQCSAGQVYGPYPIPSNTGDQIPYNTSAPSSICNPLGLGDTGHVIVVGSGAKKRSKKKAKKATAKKKSAAKKAASKTAPRRKPAPGKKAAKKATKTSASKTAKKAAKKKSTKKKSAKKSRR